MTHSPVWGGSGLVHREPAQTATASPMDLALQTRKSSSSPQTMLPSVFLCFFYGLVCYYASGAFAGRLIESPARTMICSDVGPRHSALRLRSLGAPVAVPPEPISRCTIRGRMSGSPLPSQALDFNCAFTTVLSQSLTRRNFSGVGREQRQTRYQGQLCTQWNRRT